MANKITRSTVNEQQYSAPEIATSGFPLSYRRYTNFMLGRIHVGGFHWTMPGDKISGKTCTSANGLTFKRMVTPIISPVNAMQYNIFLPLRPLDRSFKKGSTPTKENSMSANWTMPLCNTRYLFEQILRAYFNITPSDDFLQDSVAGSRLDALLHHWALTQTLSSVLSDAISAGDIAAGTTVDDLLYDSNGLVTKCVNSLITTGSIFATMADNLYLRDALIDIAANITAKLGDKDNPLSGSIIFEDFLNDWLSALFTPFIGRYSYYAEFKYNFVRPFDFYRISRQMVVQLTSISDLINCFDDTPQNEYPLRAIYAVWYELFRNVDLEPVNSNLPDWQEWSSTSIFDMSSGGNLLYLIYRIRSWEKDMFISAQIDDLSRHVYAPIIGNIDSDSVAGFHSSDVDNHDTQSSDDGYPAQPAGMRKPAVINLGYRDQLTDTDVSVSCPVPSNINDVISSTDITFIQIYGLDLNTLRQSQMLEKYLKRNYLFGDEYQDRILAHYNSRVSDMRINKPEILSQSLDGYDMKQQVSNVSTSAGTNVGDRTATATVPVNGNTYTTYCEEFGILMSIVCIMPRAMYDGICPQLLMAKQIDMPIPEFATNNEEFGRKVEIAGSGLAPLADGSDNRFMFGRYPAYHAWRSRVDEVGGEFLDELQDSTFRRFFGMFSDDTTPKLNYFFIHCRPNLQMFADPIMYDTQLYGDLVHECFVERVLPTPVEVI